MNFPFSPCKRAKERKSASMRIFAGSRAKLSIDNKMPVEYNVSCKENFCSHLEGERIEPGHSAYRRQLLLCLRGMPVSSVYPLQARGGMRRSRSAARHCAHGQLSRQAHGGEGGPGHLAGPSGLRGADHRAAPLRSLRAFFPKDALHLGQELLRAAQFAFA